jgi:hypothetical protein
MINEIVEWLHDDDPRPRNHFRGWQPAVINQLLEAGAIFAKGYLGSLECTACYHGHRARLQGSDRDRRYYCPDEGWVYPDPGATVAHRTDMLALARLLATSLGLPPGHVRRLLQTQTFAIGDMPLHGSLRTLFVTRSAETASDISEIGKLLDSVGSKHTGMILCAGDAPRSIRTKHRHEFFPLSEALQMGQAGISLDREQLEAWARGLERNRKNTATASPDPSWEETARVEWRRLHQCGKLSRSAADMGRLVHAALLKAGWKLADLPKPKSISDRLRDLHRNAFPRHPRKSRRR